MAYLSNNQGQPGSGYQRLGSTILKKGHGAIATNDVDSYLPFLSQNKMAGGHVVNVHITYPNAAGTYEGDQREVALSSFSGAYENRFHNTEET
jgi:hypothetical protein